MLAKNPLFFLNYIRGLALKLYTLLSHYIYYNTLHTYINQLYPHDFIHPYYPLIVMPFWSVHFSRCWNAEFFIYAQTISMMFFSLIHHQIFSSIHHCHRHMFVILYLILNVIFRFTRPGFILNFYSLVAIRILQ